MKRSIWILGLVWLLPIIAEAIETKIETNLSGSMSRLRLYNQTIFPQRTTLSIDDYTVDSFEMEAHEKVDVFVECHGVVQADTVPMTVHTESHEWSGQVPTARSVKRAVVLWISLQRQGRAHIEGLVRSTKPTAMVKHLSLAESPQVLAQYDNIAMVLMSAADLDRLEDDRFEVLRKAVSLGMPLVITAREAGADGRVRLASMTDAKFSKWSMVPPEVATKVPSATRVSPILLGKTSLVQYAVKPYALVVDSPLGFGQVRMVGLPVASLRAGELVTALFSDPESRLAQPMKWLETRASNNVETFFISPIVPLSGLVLLLGFMCCAVRRAASLFGRLHGGGGC